MDRAVSELDAIKARVVDAALVYRYNDRRLNQSKPQSLGRYMLSKRRRRSKAELWEALDAYIEIAREEKA